MKSDGKGPKIFTLKVRYVSISQAVATNLPNFRWSGWALCFFAILPTTRNVKRAKLTRY